MTRKGWEKYAEGRDEGSGVYPAGQRWERGIPAGFPRTQGGCLFFTRRIPHPGCTRQACGFRDAYADYERLGRAGDRHQQGQRQVPPQFRGKQALPFYLLSDPEKAVLEAYDVWKEKKMYGKVSMGVVRTTYLIDEEGRDREGLREGEAGHECAGDPGVFA